MKLLLNSKCLAKSKMVALFTDLRGGGFDPGYESVPDKRRQESRQGSEPGYETVPGQAIHMFRDPGYETVQNKADPGYATVKEHGYENLLQKAGNQHKDRQKGKNFSS